MTAVKIRIQGTGDRRQDELVACGKEFKNCIFCSVLIKTIIE